MTRIPIQPRAATRARVALHCLLLVFVGLGTGCSDTRPARPNILLIVADDFGTNHFYDAPGVTPTLDALARDGVRFPNGLVSTARCGPVRAAIHRGLYPHETGMYFNTTPFPFTFDHDNGIAATLGRAGYRTFMGGTFPGNPNHAGWDVIDAGADFARTDQTSLLDFLDESTDEPFFVWYGPRLPHIPHDPPKPYLGRIDRDEIPIPTYIEPADVEEYLDREMELYATEAWFDDRVREVLAHLRGLGELRETIVIVINDNGFQNGVVSKGSPYDAGVRTPVVFYGPRHLPERRIRSEWITEVDLYATILDYARIDRVPRNSGRSIRGLLGSPRGFDPAWPETHVSLAYPKNAETGDWWRDAMAIVVRENSHKYIRWMRDIDESNNEVLGIHHVLAKFPTRRAGDEELYDLSVDPFELANRIDEPALDETRQRLADHARSWLDANRP